MENGKIAIANNLENGIGYGSTEFHVIRLVKSGLSAKFLFYYLTQQNFRRDAQRSMTGSAGQLRVPSNFIKQVLVPLPPLDEQHRIVQKIEQYFLELDEGTNRLKETRIRLEEYRQSLLKYAFEGKLTEKWRQTHRSEIEYSFKLLEKMKQEYTKSLRQKDMQTKVAKDLSTISEEWTETNLFCLCELISGQHILERNYNRDHNGIPYITGPADFSSVHPSISKWTDKPKAIAIKNDLLITVKGAGVGKVNILNIDKAAISRQLMAIRTKLNVLILSISDMALLFSKHSSAISSSPLL